MPESFNPEFWGYVDDLVTNSKIVVDRPKDTPHPDFDDMMYPLDYGYLAGTTSTDGAGIDVWLGASGNREVQGVICTVDLLKRDSEIKILLGCTEDEMRTIAQFINSGEHIGALLIRRG